jgi:hypothetical protein
MEWKTTGVEQNNEMAYAFCECIVRTARTVFKLTSCGGTSFNVFSVLLAFYLEKGVNEEQSVDKDNQRKRKWDLAVRDPVASI